MTNWGEDGPFGVGAGYLIAAVGNWLVVEGTNEEGIALRKGVGVEAAGDVAGDNADLGLDMRYDVNS